MNTATITINDTTFENNYASTDGGAIRGSGNATVLNLKNVDFISNQTSNYGGAICTGAANGTFENAIFKQNSAYFGGAIHKNSGGLFTIDNALFESNTAREQGGVIHANGSNFDISNSIFRKNESKIGGVIYVFNNSTINITDSIFDSNVATTSGSIIRIDSANTTVTFKNSVFKNNDGKSSIVNKGTLNIISESGKSTIFTGNIATGDSSLIENNKIANFTVKTGASLLFDNNRSEYAGVFENYSGATMTITGEAGSIIEFNNNSAGFGSAIYNNGTFNITADTIKFAGNTYNADGATSGGGNHDGTIYNAGTMNIDANSVLFIGNTTKRGGAIDNTGTMTLKNGYFKGNLSLIHI